MVRASTSVTPTGSWRPTGSVCKTLPHVRCWLERNTILESILHHHKPKDTAISLFGFFEKKNKKDSTTHKFCPGKFVWVKRNPTLEPRWKSPYPCGPQQTHSSENHQCDPMNPPHTAEGGYRRWQMDSHQVIWPPKHKSDMGGPCDYDCLIFCLLCISMDMEIKKDCWLCQTSTPTPIYAKIEVNQTISSTSNPHN